MARQNYSYKNVSHNRFKLSKCTNCGSSMSTVLKGKSGDICIVCEIFEAKDAYSWRYAWSGGVIP